MNLPICALVVALLTAPVVAQAGGPDGWYLAGSDSRSYEIAIDATVFHGGGKSARLASIAEPKGFGTLMQDIDASEYRGKRLRLSAWLKVSGVKDWSGMWMRVDGASQKSLSFDNMQNRPLKGTGDWTRCEIVLDVPEASEGIFYGVLIDGPGKLWLDDIKLEAVDRSVPVTSMMNTSGAKPKSPVNTEFER